MKRMREGFSAEREREIAREKAFAYERKIFSSYLEDFDLAVEELRDKSIVDVGVGAGLFAAHVLREGITDEVISVGAQSGIDGAT